MSKDVYEDPKLQTGYTGDEAPQRPQAGPPINKAALSAEQNRGKRAPQSGSGVVVGSGAGAGGAGGAEDFDSDAAGGGGAMPPLEDDHPKDGADAPVGGSR
ncbi:MULTISPECIES: hypothetical protein [unclassified Sphingomonas]|uniref:hypothetical protein n=1 Tax=unclassified Sphingomonas TaxID=196159 RepID=UPI0006FC1B0F|nr:MULTISPECIES: hypothetical protein [unclassified Sphingomonas]KQX25062.1 hypothetical protein ASD17_23580 [Sphingomonas sp. Root1294]KQY66079.1 hypothetical protein ASD39_13380 [Sphingomonas sp. Root50]KRB89758.1 hypothetical protein ASE22_19215 [Sphingomonas sp. Root720]